VLSGLRPGTGLVPFLLGGLPQDPGRPWDTGEFSIPADHAGADDLDAARMLADMWDGEMPTGLPGDEDDEEWQAMRAPSARSAACRLTAREMKGRTMRKSPDERIGLLAARTACPRMPTMARRRDRQR
jgi:hypothetical protein